MLALLSAPSPHCRNAHQLLAQGQKGRPASGHTRNTSCSEDTAYPACTHIVAFEWNRAGIPSDGLHYILDAQFHKTEKYGHELAPLDPLACPKLTAGLFCLPACGLQALDGCRMTVHGRQGNLNLA